MGEREGGVVGREVRRCSPPLHHPLRPHVQCSLLANTRTVCKQELMCTAAPAHGGIVVVYWNNTSGIVVAYYCSSSGIVVVYC